MSNPLSERVAALTGDQRIRLLRTMVDAGEPLTPVLGVVPRRSGDGPVPLSPAQEDLWVFETLYPDSAAINLAAAYHFDHAVDRSGLEAALQLVVDRHDILRGSISGEPGDVVMVIAEKRRVVFDRADLRNGNRPAAEAYAALVDDFRRRTFDLEHDPLIRGLFLRVDDDKCVLLLGLHHIVTDWYSFDILHTEFAQAYQAVLKGVEWDAPRPEIQYGDYAVWQRELEAAGVHDRQLAFWPAPSRPGRSSSSSTTRSWPRCGPSPARTTRPSSTS